MTTLLQTKAFHRIPPANIQAIFMRMQRVPYRAGEVVIKQGDEGDYLLRHRQRQVRRHARDAAQQGRHQARRAGRRRHLRRRGADLRSQAQRHGHHADRRRADAPQQAGFPRAHERAAAAVGELRAGARDHRRAAARGSTCACRPSTRTWRIEGALNIPLYFIRLKLSTLDRNMPYVVYCDTGPAQLGRGVHPGGARLRRLRAARAACRSCERGLRRRRCVRS